MSNDFKKVNEKDLAQAAGGKGELASHGGGPVWKVKGLSGGTLPLKSDPSSDGSEIAMLKTGDVVQAAGGKIRTGDAVNGQKPTTYTYVYVPSLKQSGWVDSDFIG